jgi:hypothetical protein
VAIAIAVGVFLFFDLIVVTTLIRSCIAPIRELAKQFPAQMPAADSIQREFQSFTLGIVNAGWGIHVGVDDQYLHLSPAWIVRIFGMPPVSIPWAKIHLIKRGRRMTKVLIKGDRERMEIRGPAWCMKLASA